MGLGLSIHIMEKNNVPVTTNQVSLDSLDWLKEPPKNIFPFWISHWEIRKSSRCIREVFEVFEGCIGIIQKIVPRTHIQYVLNVPVVPHKAVAEVSEQETYRRRWLL